jgi:hypothetical protein
MYYLSFDFIIYKITRGIDTINDNVKTWWINTFVKRQQDQGYTLIDTATTTATSDSYLSYDELWGL